VKIDGAPEIGVVAIINRATEGPFDEQPLREKDIPGEAGIKLAGIALGIDRPPKMQTRSQEVVQETILIFSTDWSIQQLKIDVGYSLLVRFWTVDPEKGSGAEFKKSWIRRDWWVLTGLARTKSGQARRGRRRRMVHCRRRQASEAGKDAAQACRPRCHDHHFIERFCPHDHFGRTQTAKSNAAAAMSGRIVVKRQQFRPAREEQCRSSVCPIPAISSAQIPASIAPAPVPHLP